MSVFYVLEGKEVVCVGDDVELWSQRFELDNRQIGDDHIDGVRVSTVFMGVDHNFDPDGEPLLFETMIFGGEHDKERWRYSTFDEAEAGHVRAVDLVKNVAGRG